jgi:predicted dehydrogenase
MRTTVTSRPIHSDVVMVDLPAPARLSPLTVAVVGTGGISQEHLSFLAGRTGVGPVAERARLAAVCDLSAAAANYAARTFGAAASYTDVKTMLAEVRPDVVHVLTPPASHVPLATQCLQAGAHVLCEKPVTASRPELEALLEVAHDNGRRLMESQNYRFNAAIVAIKDAIGNGQLGAVREIEVRIALPVTDPGGRFGDPNLPSPIHAMPAGVIHDFTTHFTSLLLDLGPGVDYSRVAAAWNRHGSNDLFRFDDLDALLIGDGPQGPVHARLRFDSRTFPDVFTVMVRGSEGTAETDLFQPYLRIVRPRPGGSKLSPIVNHVVNGLSMARSGVRNLGQRLVQQGQYEGLHRMLDLAYRALASGSELPVTEADMLGASALVDKLLSDEVAL